MEKLVTIVTPLLEKVSNTWVWQSVIKKHPKKIIILTIVAYIYYGQKRAAQLKRQKEKERIEQGISEHVCNKIKFF